MILQICFLLSFPLSVPPTLSLSLDGVTIVNKTYKGNETDFREEQDKYVEEGEEINITCFAEGAKPVANLSWIINGIPYEGVNSEPIRNSNENKTFDSNSTLIFNATGENVTATCNSSLYASDIETLISATFVTYVKPDVFLIINGSKLSETLYLVEGESANITCHASGARPAATLTWRGKYNLMEKGPSQSNQNGSTLFNTSSTILFEAKEVNENVTCKSIIEGTSVNEEVSLRVFTCAVPEVSLTVEGYNASDVIHINESELVNIVCNVSGARPTATITLKKNGKTIPDNSFTRDIEREMVVYPRFDPQDNDTIECVSTLGGCDIVEVVKIRFVANADYSDYDKSSGQNLTSAWAIPAAVITFIILVIYCVYNGINRYKASRRANLAGNFGMPMSEYSHTINTLPKSLPKEFPEDGFHTNPKPPNKELPKIPSGSEISYYDDLSEHENTYELQFHNTSEYYSTMSNSGGKGRMFYENDLCFILNMNMGNIYNRWMGTIAVSKEATKCVVFTTVTDNILRQSQIQWDKFVKRALELPKNNHLTKIEGIGIDKGKLYLIQDHLACETLDVRISIPIFPTEVMRYLLGILEGLEVIQSFGFLHPGLSTKKVLLTKQGICKLYDFCLSDDASNTVKIKKSLMICSVNQFAPESLLRNEYDQSSDVWSAAVVIWEIMSNGLPPFSQEEQSAPIDPVAISIPEAWPAKFRGLRNKRLYECWNKDSSLRLTINQLRLSFKEMFESLDTYGDTDMTEDDPSDSYVPMQPSGNSGDGIQTRQQNTLPC